MGKANARNKIKKSYLDEINYIDRIMKRVKNDEEESSKLLKKRELLRNKLQEENRELQKRFEETAMELDELTVSVNGNEYKVI